ncbi:hypothetical protein LZ31DRAFT_591066 [Colletotrichum somersetense]|nr:hypothetical protein LZ31DRAFT_591066 [Colletotrichum somersetense]
MQQAFGVSYLRSIGFSNSEVTWTLIAAPLAGLFLPPIVASISDGSRRRPILGGALGVVVALICLAWAQEASSFFLGVLRLDSPAAVVTGGKFVAVVTIYLLNIAIQPMHISLRALLMDVCPPQQQATASLWITRLSSSGSVLGTGLAFFTKPSFKLLSVICCAALCSFLSMHTISAHDYYAKQEEEILGKVEVKDTGNLRSVASKMRCLVNMSVRLPEVTHQRASETSGRSRVTKADAEAASAGYILVFHSVILVTTVLMQRLSGTRPSPGAANNESTALDSNDNLQLLEEQNKKLFKVWSLALATAAGALAVASTLVLGGVDRAAPLILSSLGVQFAISNWIPYGLIATDLAVVSKAEEDADDDGDKLDGAAAILAIHNGAICLPQIASAVACGLFFRITESLGLVVDVFWTFLLVMPTLLIAAYGSWPLTRRFEGSTQRVPLIT